MHRRMLEVPYPNAVHFTQTPRRKSHESNRLAVLQSSCESESVIGGSTPGACRRDYFPPVIFSAVFVPLWVGSIVFEGIKEIRGWICKSEIVSAYGIRVNPATGDALPVPESESIRDEAESLAAVTLSLTLFFRDDSFGAR